MAVEQTTRGSNMDYRGGTGDTSATSAKTNDPQNEDVPDCGILNPNPEFREIFINKPQVHEGKNFKGNKIDTGKYTLISFLPKFLYEQFRRYANIFFLAIGLLQQIPNVSPTGRYVTIVPFSIILGLTALKEAVEDFKRHKADDAVNNSIVEVLNVQIGKFEKRAWKDVKVGDIVRITDGKFFPADLVLLSSSEVDGLCFVETSNLDGETNLKLRSCVQLCQPCDSPERLSQLRGELQCELPNRNLYEFNGNIKLDEENQFTPLNAGCLLLRGAKLMNTDYAHGFVVYTGHETKLLKNSNKAPLKRSTIDRIVNRQIIFLFGILIAISLVSALANTIQSGNGQDHWYLGPLKQSSFFYNFLTFVILYNNLIPISLQVTLEFVKFIQAYFINWDYEMYYEPSGTFALARTSNLNEELGQIKYVFSDKTGTLTQNVMEFKECTIAGQKFSVDERPGSNEKQSPLLTTISQGGDVGQAAEEFLTMMAVCHTVLPEKKSDASGGEAIAYNASSPDEKALVEGAARYLYTFVERRMPETVIFTKPDGSRVEYQVLDVIEFTSTRKRMSVVVKDERGQVKLFIKGADTMIFDRLGSSLECRQYYDVTLSHLEAFARTGLRTLCFATRSIDDAEYARWKADFHKATTSMGDREANIAKVAEDLERDLTLVGASAIEDKLQDGVPETIAMLLEANIKVWLLTGDKQETAINIGHSCSLIKEGMPLIIINTLDLESTKKEIESKLKEFRESGSVGKDNLVALVVDGKTLHYALDPALRDDFLSLCTSCNSVICCRVSPIQKAEMVELVQDKTKAISLAIGDGANDVAMIQKADVGVGISGNEGLQAANSSDFAIAQFRYLARLLFVHGAWNYSRISKVILYSFYKNICLYIIELWFAIYNYWSGQVLFERWTIGMYNIFFTSWPPLAMGLFDQQCTAETRMKYPSLYKSSQNSKYFNLRVFWQWIGLAILHSMILYWLPMSAYNSESVWDNGKTGGYLVIGNTVYTFVVITVCLKASLEMDAWNYLTHLSIWGSIAFWAVFICAYSYAWPAGLPIASNMAGIITLIFTTASFWMGMFYVPLTSLLTDIFYKIWRTTVKTSETDKIRIAEIMKRDVANYVEGNANAPINPGALFERLRRFTSKDRSTQNESTGGGVEMRETGYAFSEEEGGVRTKEELIRRATPSRKTSDCRTTRETD